MCWSCVEQLVNCSSSGRQQLSIYYELALLEQVGVMLVRGELLCVFVMISRFYLYHLEIEVFFRVISD